MLALLPGTAFAAENRQSAVIYVGPNQIVNDNLYATGGIVDIEGTVRGDVFAIGATVTVPGSVTGDLNATGGLLTMSGKIGGNVRTASAVATINGTVGGGVTVSGGTLSIGPRAQIAQDVLILGSSATVDGALGHDLRAFANDLTIGGTIGGNVRANVSTLRLTKGAHVGGNLVYTSAQEAQIAPGATVRGTVERREPRAVGTESPPAAMIWQLAFTWPATEVGVLILGLVYVLLFPFFSHRTIGAIRRSPWTSLLLGFVLLVDVPVAALVLFIIGLSIGGWWLGPMLLALYGITLLLGYITAALFIGSYLFSLTGRSNVPLAAFLLIGLIVLTVLGLLPYVGGLVGFAATLFGLGALVVAAIQERQALPRSFSD